MLTNKTSGNVLVFILIAIFLMGALTMLFVRSDGQSEDTGDTERTSIQASRLLTYASKIQNATDMLRSHGCGENQISFWIDSNADSLETAADYAYNSAAPTDHSCHVYEPQGGGVDYQKADSQWMAVTTAYQQFILPGNNYCIYGVGTGTTTCTKATTDLFISLDGITLALCNEINRRVGVDQISGNPPADEISNNYSPVFADPVGINNGIIGDDSTASAQPLKNKRTACVLDTTGSGSGRYHFYRVLIAR